LPDDLSDAKCAFTKRWTNARLSWQGAELFHQLWPNLTLVRNVETMFDSARYDGRRGDPFRLQDYRAFAAGLPPSTLRTIQGPKRFLLLAFRQYQIGRARLVKELLAKHEEQRQRERLGLSA
jgi:hypothetical protein